MNNKNLVAVTGTTETRLSWFPLTVQKQVIIKGINIAEVKSKGERRIIKEKTGKWPVKNSTLTVSYFNVPE